VFTSPTGEPLRYGNFYRRPWKRALQNADLPPVGLHVLRHTCASLLIAHGAPIKAVQAQLGHQSAELTLDRYGHLYPDQMAVLAERLEEARDRALDGIRPPEALVQPDQ
jgi:integrase